MKAMKLLKESAPISKINLRATYFKISLLKERGRFGRTSGLKTSDRGYILKFEFL